MKSGEVHRAWFVPARPGAFPRLANSDANPHAGGYRETLFDVVGAVIPPLKPLMFWVSTVFLGLLAVVALIGAVAHLMMAMGLP